MRKLMALAIVLVCAGTTRSWAVLGLGNVSYDGSLEVNGISANNEVDKSDKASTSDHRGEVNTRLRVGINADVTEKVKTRIEFLRRDAKFGRSLTGATGPSASNSIDNETARIRIENAYLDFEDIFGLRAVLGRQYVGNPGDLVWNISPTDDDSLNSRAIDGLLLQEHKYDFVHADLFLGKAVDNDAVGNTAQDDTGLTGGDTNLSSFDLVFPTLIPGGKINAGYLWGVNTSSNPTSNNNVLTIWRIGVRGGVMENMITYRAEFFQNGGENKSTGTKVKYKGNALDLGVGLNSKETKAGKFGVNLNFLMASGDSNTGDNDDKAFHDFTQLGFGSSDRLLGEIFGKSNTLTRVGGLTRPGVGADTGAQGSGLQVWNLGVQYMPAFWANSTFMADYYKFDTSEDGNTSAQPKADSYGSEVDLGLAYDHTANVRTEFGWAAFMPDDAIVGTETANPGRKDDTVTKLYARAKVKWGGSAE
jgi:hypothetical protein